MATIKTHKLVDTLEWLRKQYWIPYTDGLKHNSRSNFHKSNYLSELDRLEVLFETQLKGVRKMKALLRRIG